MPLAAIEYVLEQASAACAAAGRSFSAFPMHEVAAHPQAPEVLRLFARYPGDPSLDDGRPMFQHLSTTGVPLALRDDWEDVLATCRELGTTVVWPAVHGWSETHNRIVHRTGAYQETLLGIDRMRAAGMEVGCNVFLTRENVGELDAMIADLLAHGVTQFAIEVATYLPTARSRFFHCEEWLNLSDYTEAAHVRQALTGVWPPPDPGRDELSLVCRPNLDLFWGAPRRYRRRFGNLRREDAQQVLRAALTDGGGSKDTIWFDLDPVPDVRALAERYGDPVGERIHLWAESLRRRWLDLAQQEHWRPRHDKN
jgi:hypothetical protein